MITEIGHFSLILALCVAVLQAVVPLAGASRNDPALTAWARPAALTQFLFVGVAFLALTNAYVVSDFSVANVAANSNSMKPLLYKISGVWSNHEGSMLLWVFILALFGAAVAAFGRNLPPGLRARVLAVQAMIGVGFLLFILLTSNPFLRQFPVPADGAGLNPILQDPGLAFHPPFLYLGYVGFSIAFCFAIAALIEGRVDPAWARWVRPWTLAAWCALTIGIAMGSWWSYYTLGWGGWWFWDPVENASFMPWLVGTALLHSAVVVEKRDALKTWTVLLAILAFSLSLLGTFLVRSGVLTSVHAFASDPRRGVFILLLLSLYTGGALLLFAWRAPQLQGGGLFAPISREGGLLLNNLLLTTAAATVLLGTLYPLFLDLVAGQKVSVGPPFYNMTFVPIMVPLLVAMGVGPILPWKRGDLWAALSRLKLAFAVTAAIALLVLIASGAGSVGAASGLGLAAWLFAATLAELADRIGLFDGPVAERLAPDAAPAARRLGHDPGACRNGRRDRRDRRLVVLDRGENRQRPPGSNLRPGRVSDRARCGQPGQRPRLRGDPRRYAAAARRARDRVAAPGAAHLPERHGDSCRDPHQSAFRCLCRDRRSGGRRRLCPAPLLQPAGAVDLARRGRYGAGRAGLAVRPAAPDRRPGAAGSASRGGRLGPGGRMKRSDRCCGGAGCTCCRWRFSRCWRSGFTAVSRPIRPCCRRR